MNTQRPMISQCPSCSQPLAITQLSCKHCGLVLSHDFTLNRLARLKEDDTKFVELFLKCGGNSKEMQKLLHLSYPAVKKRLANILDTLDLSESKPSPPAAIEPVIKALPLYEDESPIVRLVKQKLNASAGMASVPLPRGGSFLMLYEEYGNGLCTNNLPKNRVITWKALNCAMELLSEKKQAFKNGTQDSPAVSKGNAMKGKLGDKDLPLNSLEGYVAYHAYNQKPGDSCQRMVPSLSAILEWSGLCKNGYGYVELIE